MTHSIMVDEKHEVFDFPAETKPLLIRFDEGNVLIKEVNIPKELDELLYQLRNDDVIGRMSAAAALLQFKHDPRTFEALAASAQGEPFWALRRSAIEALGKLQDKRVTAVLKKASLDAHSSVRTSSLAALGDLKDRGLADFFKERFEKDESELVKAEALRAIGKTGDASFIPFLEKCVSIRSYRNNVGNAATQALKQLRTK
jgi:aminopeptidase N